MSVYRCGQKQDPVWRRVSRDSGVLRVNRQARLRGMNEGCREALRETLAVSPALSIMACISNGLNIRPHKKEKKKKLASSFLYRSRQRHRQNGFSGFMQVLCAVARTVGVSLS